MKRMHPDNATSGFSLVDILFTFFQIILITAGILVFRVYFGWRIWLAVPAGLLLGLVVMWGGCSLLAMIAESKGSTWDNACIPTKSMPGRRRSTVKGKVRRMDMGSRIENSTRRWGKPRTWGRT
jgi:hypothetical protein